MLPKTPKPSSTDWRPNADLEHLPNADIEHLPNADFEHAAEELWVVGDDPADVDDQFLLQYGLPLLGALAVDNALNDPRGQRVGDHLLLLPKQPQRHLA